MQRSLTAGLFLSALLYSAGAAAGPPSVCFPGRTLAPDAEIPANVGGLPFFAPYTVGGTAREPARPVLRDASGATIDVDISSEESLRVEQRREERHRRARAREWCGRRSAPRPWEMTSSIRASDEARLPTPGRDRSVFFDDEMYLRDVLLRVSTHPASDIDALLPHRWAPTA